MKNKKNKAILYLGGYALVYYLYQKNKKTSIPKNLLVIETPTIQALNDTSLKNLIIDLLNNPKKYQNAEVYLRYAKAELQNRINAGKGSATTTKNNLFSV